MSAGSLHNNIAYVGNELYAYFTTGNRLFSREDKPVTDSKRDDPLHTNCRCCFYCMTHCGYDIIDRSLLFPAMVNNWRVATVQGGNTTAVASFDGTIVLLPTTNIQVEFSVDKAILMTHFKQHISLAMNSDKSLMSFYHPMGYVTYKKDYIEMMIFGTVRNKLFRLQSDCIQFTMKHDTFTYRLDEHGLKKTMMQVFAFDCVAPEEVFYCGSLHGPDLIEQCMKIIDNGRCVSRRFDYASWNLNAIRIIKERYRRIQVTKDDGRTELRLSEDGLACISTPPFYCCASVGPENHIFVRFGLCRIYCNGRSISVRYSTGSAQYDKDGTFDIE